MGKLPKAPITSRIDKRLDFTGHLEESKNDIPFNTSDPCVLDDDADLLLVADVTVLGLRGAFHEIGPLPKEVDDRDVVTRAALETNGTLLLHSDDVTVPHPLGKPSINIRQSPFLANNFEIQSLALDVST